MLIKLYITVQVASCVKASPNVSPQALGLYHLSPERRTLELTDGKTKDGQEVQIKHISISEWPLQSVPFFGIRAATVTVKL